MDMDLDLACLDQNLYASILDIRSDMHFSGQPSYTWYQGCQDIFSICNVFRSLFDRLNPLSLEILSYSNFIVNWIFLLFLCYYALRSLLYPVVIIIELEMLCTIQHGWFGVYRNPSQCRVTLRTLKLELLFCPTFFAGSNYGTCTFSP